MTYINSWFFRLDVWVRLLIIALFALLIGILALKRHMLKKSGIAAMVVVCFIITYISGPAGLLLMLFFFLSSGLLGKAVAPLSPHLEKKGDERDWAQVLANSVPAMIGLFMFRFSPWKEAGMISFAAAIAEATSDTWAGEMGLLSKRDPVSLITFTRVPKGLSGGISLIGTFGCFLASLCVALLFCGSFAYPLMSIVLITGTGFLGGIFDSFLGATLQVQYRRKDGKLTEKEYEDGEKLERARGIPHFDNDMVNLVSGLFSSNLAFLIAALI